MTFMAALAEAIKHQLVNGRSPSMIHWSSNSLLSGVNLAHCGPNVGLVLIFSIITKFSVAKQVHEC